MRICKQCGERPTIEGSKRPICRPCKKEYDRLWWAANKESKLAAKVQRNKENRASKQEFVWNYLQQNHCPCGESDPIVLQFDHTKDKEFDIAIGIRDGYSLARLEKEIQKCQVLCANCHLKKTAKDYGYWKTLRVVR